MQSPHGHLALIIVLDQFTRNIHRGTAAAFSNDQKALERMLAGIDAGIDRGLEPIERVFFYMPMQHSERMDIQDRGVETFAALAREPAPPHIANALRGFLNYAKLHRDIVARFGRFPHRNDVLGRKHTDAELQFLADGGHTFGQ